MVKETRYREVVAYLKKIGWVHTTTRGSHEKWVSPTADTLIIPKSSSISPGVMRQVIKKLGSEAPTKWK